MACAKPPAGTAPSLSIRWRDATGRERMEPVGTSPEMTRAKAAKIRHERRVDVRRDGLRHPASTPTLRVYAGHFLEVHPGARNLEETSTEHYRVALGRLLPALGDRTLSELEHRPELIERWSTAALRGGRAPATVLKTIVALSTMMKRAQRERLVRVNPRELIDRPRVRQSNLGPLAADEIVAVLAAFTEMEAEAKPADAAWFATARRMVVLAISTGLRRGELLGLRWGDVDLLAGFVRVQRSVTRGKVKDVKTVNSRRTLELGPEARAALEEQYATSAFTDDDHSCSPTPPSDSKLDPAKLGRRYVRPAQARAGVRESFRPFHDLRHTALTFSAAVNPG